MDGVNAKLFRANFNGRGHNSIVETIANDQSFGYNSLAMININDWAQICLCWLC